MRLHFRPFRKINILGVVVHIVLWQLALACTWTTMNAWHTPLLTFRSTEWMGKEVSGVLLKEKSSGGHQDPVKCQHNEHRQWFDTQQILERCWDLQKSLNYHSNFTIFHFISFLSSAGLLDFTSSRFHFFPPLCLALCIHFVGTNMLQHWDELHF